jgi:hypothetical protein
MAIRYANESESNGLHLSWAMVAVMATLGISIIVGSLRLGAIQQSVEINTGRLDKIELNEHTRISDIARLKAEQESNEHRLDTIESTRPTTGELSGTTRSTEVRIEGIERRVQTLEAAPRAPAIAIAPPK